MHFVKLILGMMSASYYDKSVDSWTLFSGYKWIVLDSFKIFR